MTIEVDDLFGRTGALVGSVADVGATWQRQVSAFSPTAPTCDGGAAVLSNVEPDFFRNEQPTTGNTHDVHHLFTPYDDNWQSFTQARVQPDGVTCYQLLLGPGAAAIYKRTSGSQTWAGDALSGTASNFSLPAGHRSLIETQIIPTAGGVITAYVNGTLLDFGDPVVDPSPLPAGEIGFGGRAIATTRSYVDSTTVGGGDTTAPIITGPGGATGSTSAVSVAENTTAVANMTANETVTWSLNGGADAARFTIDSGGNLAFSSAPDYEAPSDSDTNNVYVVVVRATDTATPTPNTTDQTVTVTVTNVAEGGDSTNPTLTGSITVSALTTTSYTLTWPAGSDNVAVTGYEVSLNGGSSYASAGNVLTANVAGRTPGSTDAVRVRAFDAAGLRSTPALSASVTLNSVATGTLTLTTPLVNNTGGISGRWAGTTGIRLSVISKATGLSVLAVTGRATDSSGVLTAAVTDAAITTGQEYGILATMPDGSWDLSAPLTAT